MQQVIDPSKNKLITVEEYIKEYAKNSLDNLGYTAPLMVCPHCLNDQMKLKARSSINVSPSFVHPKNHEYIYIEEWIEKYFEIKNWQH